MNLEELCLKLSSFETQNERFAFAEKFGKALGSGAGRFVYLIDGYVVKLLCHESERFQQQNDVAAMKLGGNIYIPQLFAYDARGFDFLIMEYLEEVSQTELPPASDIFELCKYISYHCGTSMYMLGMELHETYHWGRSKDGHLKALDFGC